jgi:DNA-directed RNA polymerase specialized sigma24 family protein
VSDAANPRDLLTRHHRRLAHCVRTLLPDAGEAESALRETALRIGRRGYAAAAAGFAAWPEDVAREVANERRKAAPHLTFSDDLFRQLASATGPTIEKAEARARALAECLPQLPPPERELLRKKYGLGLTVEQIGSSEGRPPAAVVRDLAGLHESLGSALQTVCPDGGPEPPGGGADLGRLADQLLDGTINPYSRLVLETLLLADSPAQAHYRRHVALVTDLEWAYRGTPALPELPPEPPGLPGLTRRERVVTAAFVVTGVAVLLFVVLLIAGIVP